MKIVNCKLKIILALLIVVLASNLTTKAAHAQGVSLSTYPSTIHLRVQPPADVRSSFSIQNISAETVKLNIILKPFKADTAQDGKLLYSEGNDPTIFKKIQVVDNGFAVSSIELGPKQSKTLSLRIDVDEKEPTTDYYFSVIFLTAEPGSADETATDATARSNAQAGIALNVLMNVGPKELPRGYLEEFSTPAFRSSGPVPFTVKLKNNGVHYFTPKGVILIKNIFGQTVGRIDLQNANILAGTGRTLVGTPYQTSAKIHAANSDLSSQQAVWPEKFLLGFYKADLSIALSEEGPLFTQTISFLALPTTFLIGLSIAGLIILLITLRIRRKLRES